MSKKKKKPTVKRYVGAKVEDITNAPAEKPKKTPAKPDKPKD